MEDVARAVGAPPVWIVVFCRKTTTRWVARLCWGRYKHVRAYAFVPVLRAWLFYDVSLSNTAIYAAPDSAETERYIGEFVRDADLVSVKSGVRAGLQVAPFTCVSAVKHLIGIKSRALRPDSLYRDCLAAGGTPLGQ